MPATLALSVIAGDHLGKDSAASRSVKAPLCVGSPSPEGPRPGHGFAQPGLTAVDGGHPRTPAQQPERHLPAVPLLPA